MYLFIFHIYLFLYLVAPGLSCSRQAPQLQYAKSQLRHACGIQFPDQISNPGPLHWEHGVLSTVPPGKSPVNEFRMKEGNRTLSFGQHHSNNCCRQVPQNYAEISGWKIEEKQVICIISKYLSQDILIIKGKRVTLQWRKPADTALIK